MRNTILFISLILAGCSGSRVRNGGSDAPPPGAAQAGKELSKNSGWAGNMQKMAHDLEVLLPYVVSRQEFSAPENRSQITEMVENFNRNVSSVPAHVGEKMLGDDPIIRYSLGHLVDDSNQALKALKEDRVEFARNTLRESIGNCFNCHTTQQLGPENNFSTEKLSAKFRMYPTERAEYYVATRQFDRAIEMLEGVLTNTNTYYDEPHEQSTALKKYLSLMVRVKKDPKRTADVIEKYLLGKKPPMFLASEAQVWLKSLKSWEREKKKVANPVAKARELLAKGEHMQSGGGFQSGYVENLRATALLHDALRTVKKPEEKAAVYLMLGNAYDILSDLGLWDLPEVYFEECIQTSPKTETAKQCYKNYERSIILGFSGSSGVFIPSEEREKLAKLKGEAGL
jgi:hypothetical protein